MRKLARHFFYIPILFVAGCFSDEEIRQIDGATLVLSDVELRGLRKGNVTKSELHNLRSGESFVIQYEKIHRIPDVIDGNWIEKLTLRLPRQSDRLDENTSYQLNQDATLVVSALAVEDPASGCFGYAKSGVAELQSVDKVLLIRAEIQYGFSDGRESFSKACSSILGDVFEKRILLD